MNGVHLVIVDHGLDTNFRKKVDDILRSPVELGMALLASEPLHFGNAHAGDPDFGQRLTHVVHLERFDDCDNLLHGLSPRGLSTL
jgi:hypothetical protein